MVGSLKFLTGNSNIWFISFLALIHCVFSFKMWFPGSYYDGGFLLYPRQFGCYLRRHLIIFKWQSLCLDLAHKCWPQCSVIFRGYMILFSSVWLISCPWGSLWPLLMLLEGAEQAPKAWYPGAIMQKRRVFFVCVDKECFLAGHLLWQNPLAGGSCHVMSQSGFVSRKT